MQSVCICLFLAPLVLKPSPPKGPPTPLSFADPPKVNACMLMGMALSVPLCMYLTAFWLVAHGAQF